MMRKPIRTLWAAIPLAVVLMLALPLSAFASSTILDVHLNGSGPPVTVSPGESIEMTVDVRNDSNGDHWHATAWQIGSGGWHCVDTPDQDGWGDKSVTFNINAPTSAGTYDFDVRVYASYSSCEDGDDPKAEYEGTGIVVEMGNPEITTEADPTTATVDVETEVGDTATITGGNSPTGDVQFTLYSDDECTTPVLFGSGGIRDEFSNQLYSNQDGSAPWSTDWVEWLDDGSPTSGSIQIRSTPAALSLNFGGHYNLSHSIEREANLSGVTSAFLSFDYSNSGNLEVPGDLARVWISSDGGYHWTSLATIDAATSGSYGADITSYIASDTRVRFSIWKMSGDYGSDEYFYIDNVNISFSPAPLTCSDTISGGSASCSVLWSPDTAGTYYWGASYEGDENNNGTSVCGGDNEEIVVSARGTGCPVFQSASENANNSEPYDTISLPKPAGTEAGDLLIAVITLNGGSINDVATPAGWNPIRTTYHSDWVRIETFWRAVDASDESVTNYVFSLISGSASTTYAAGGILRYSGGPTTSPIDASTGNGGLYTRYWSVDHWIYVNPPTAPSISVLASANEPVIAAFGFNYHDGNIDAPTSWDERVDQHNNSSWGPTIEVSDHVFTTTGPTLDQTAGDVELHYSWVAQQIALSCGGGCTPLSVTDDPDDVEITYGEDASFTVAGTDYTSVQWQVNSGSGWSDISGANSTTYALTMPDVSMTDNQYRAVLSGDCEPDATSNAATLTVSKAPSTVTVTCPASVVYNGSAQTPCTAEATGVGMSAVDVSASLVYANNTNVGTATASASWAGDANHTGSSGSGSFAITARPITVTPDAGQSKVYGNADPALTYTYSPALVSGDGFTGALSRDSGEDVGFYEITQGTLAIDDGNGGNNYDLTFATGVDFEITKATLTVTADNQTAQYSDGTPPLTFQYSGFQGDDDEGDIDTDPTCSTARMPSDPAGTFDITCGGADDNNYTFEYEDGTFTVTHEDADISLDNEVAFLVDDPGEDIDTLILYADVQETYPDAGYGPTAGEIDNAQVSMTLAPVGPGSPINGTCVKEHDNTLSGYDQINTYACTFTNVEVNTYLVEANVIGDYYSGGPAEDVLVVYDPSLGFTTAGGWFYWPDTTDKTNFGYTMKYNKKGNKVQGSLLLIRHTAAGNYRVKSNALDGLALGEFEAGGQFVGWASFSGKCTYQEPGWEDPEGNHVFLVYVEDWGEPGAGFDKLWFDVDDDDGNLSMMTPVQGNLETLGGGNIVVPHTPN